MRTEQPLVPALVVMQHAPVAGQGEGLQVVPAPNQCGFTWVLQSVWVRIWQIGTVVNPEKQHAPVAGGTQGLGSQVVPAPRKEPWARAHWASL